MLSVNFVVKLPESSRHDVVMTVMDSVSKKVHFVLMHIIVIAEGAARLFLHYIVTLQMNFLQKITFDTLYTNKFLIRVRSRALSIPSERNTI